MKSKKTHVFDIDGTLTPHRQRITDEFLVFLNKWRQGNNFYLATGSDFEKVQEQLPQEIIDAAEGVFCCMGNQLFMEGGKVLVYQNSFTPEEKLITKLENYLEHSEYPSCWRAKPHFEYRVGMMNFSVAGRGSDLKTRQLYSNYDEKTRERESISESLRGQFPLLDFVVGGKISIDIFEKGRDKSQVVDWILKNDRSRIVYIGDRAFKGGNDHAAVVQIENHRAGTWFNVSSWKETMAILKISNLVTLKDGVTKK